MKLPTIQQKSCDPQHFPEVPEKTWNLEQLGDYARTQISAIVEREHSVTANYWRLGAALNLARRHFDHGHWGRFLHELGIDKTRASKACAISRSFKRIEMVEHLTVDEAYDRRRRKLPKRSPKRARRRIKLRKTDMVDCLSEVCQLVNIYREQIDQVQADRAAAWLPAIDSTLEELTKFRTQLAQRADAQ